MLSPWAKAEGSSYFHNFLVFVKQFCKNISIKKDAYTWLKSCIYMVLSLVKFLVVTGPSTTQMVSSTVSLNIPTMAPSEEPKNGETESEEETKWVSKAVIIGVWTGAAIMSVLVSCLGVRIIIRQQRLVSVAWAESITTIADTGN